MRREEHVKSTSPTGETAGVTLTGEWALAASQA
jgi:hypothetical protein